MSSLLRLSPSQFATRFVNKTRQILSCHAVRQSHDEVRSISVDVSRRDGCDDVIRRGRDRDADGQARVDVVARGAE